MDSSPSYCRAVLKNIDCGARTRIEISKQDKKKKKHRHSKGRKGFFWRPLKKKLRIRRRKSGKRALIGITASIRDYSQERDLCEGEGFDPRIIVSSHSKIAMIGMAYSFYSQSCMQLPYAIPLLQQIVPIIIENAIIKNAIRSFLTLQKIKKSKSAIQTFDTLTKVAVEYIPAVDSAISVCDAIGKRKTTPVEKIIQMESSAVDIKIEETLLSAMDSPGLILAVIEAKKRDIRGVKDMDGSSHRFTTLKELWPSERLKDVQIAFREENSKPFFNRVAATQFLCLWHSSLTISRGAPQLRQRILDNTFAFQTRMINHFEDIVTFKKPVSQSDPFFTNFHIWGHSLPYMQESINKIKAEETSESWQERESELIKSSF